MEDLLNKHYTKPNFNLDGVKLPIGKSMDFTDTNGILNQFTISSVENGVASINGNTLTITSNSTENVKVKLIKNYHIGHLHQSFIILIIHKML